MERYLSILEVSQKQAYIFSSNKLHDNIRRSALIAWITSPKYFEEVTDDKNLFDGEKNLVYSGGGHIVLVFDSYEKAVAFNRMVTTAIRKSYEGIEVFVSVRKYETEGKDGMPLTATKNLSHLKESLEWKKSIRRASFHQGSFGLATLSADTRNVTSDAASIKMTKDALELDHWIMPGEYKPAYEFGNLGGTVGDNNYIAVIHLDGNGMGSRINDFYEKNEGKDWEEFRKSVLEYSDAIDADYKKAFKEMMQQVADKLDEPDGTLKKELDLKENYFPVRRIISSGDDVTFVTEGRIGIECAAMLIEKLNGKTNQWDEAPYSACAGVAIVHQKYPFYKAYELAEQLCSNAKKFNASLSPSDNGACISSIDWHIEMGEIRDSLEDTRREYNTLDGRRLEMRPYIISAPPEILKKEAYRSYDRYTYMMKQFREQDQDEQYSRLKKLRVVLKQGLRAADDYMNFHKIKEITREGIQLKLTEEDLNKIGSGAEIQYEIFHTTSDGIDRSILFDAAESIEFFISLRG